MTPEMRGIIVCETGGRYCFQNHHIKCTVVCEEEEDVFE